MIGCGYFIAICYRNTQAKVLKETDNNQYELLEYNIHVLNIVLQYSTVRYQIEETNFLLPRKILTNATVEFGNRCFFKAINFDGYEFFRTVSDSYFRVTFISGSENHKSNDNF